ncbi:MAG: M23 family metallopeptidase [Gulosibacter sp.]|uniref:M23 family metallopeptidase n=1 Tax=Gulosibacter sp. TaxID=2817531 RepID=UPI003F90DC33
MSRTISALRPLWSTLMGLTFAFVTYSLVARFAAPLPEFRFQFMEIGLAGFTILLLVLISIAPRAPVSTVTLASPVRGRWTTMNSPGQQLPSHGTRTRGQYSAIDMCRPSESNTPPMLHWGFAGERPESYASFGQPIHSMAPGCVVRVRDGQRDHRARNTWPSFLWMMTIEGLLREIGGTRKVLGNHVIIDHGDGTFAAYAHAKRGTAAVVEGDQVTTGQILGEVGNTGNSSMPHLHVQLMDRANVDAAAGIPMRWEEITFDGDLDSTFAQFAKDPQSSALADMPRNGEIFTAAAADTVPAPYTAIDATP